MSPLGPPPSVRCAAAIFPESQVDRTQSRTSQDADGRNAVLMRTLPRVATEMALHLLAYNLTRVMNILGIQPLLAAMRA